MEFIHKNLSVLHYMTFSALRKRHMQAVIDSCPLSFQAKSHMKSVCSQMYKYAIDMEIVTTNYASLVELPTKENSQLHKPFSREELARLWEHTEDTGAKVALILCYTSLRLPNLRRLKQLMLTWQNGTLRRHKDSGRQESLDTDSR